MKEGLTIIFDDDNIKLELVINEQMRPIQQPKQPKRQGAKLRNKYEAEAKANLVINEPMRQASAAAASRKI